MAKQITAKDVLKSLIRECLQEELFEIKKQLNEIQLLTQKVLLESNGVPSSMRVIEEVKPLFNKMPFAGERYGMTQSSPVREVKEATNKNLDNDPIMSLLGQTASEMSAEDLNNFKVLK